MDVGLVIGGPLAQLPALARRAEQSGVHTVWLHEAGHDVMVAAAIVAAATERVRVGSDVAVALARTPTLAAYSARDLQELSGGRFVLGVGSQVRRIIDETFSTSFDPIVGRMAEYVGATRAVLATLAGRPTTFEGDHYRVVRPDPYGGADAELMPPPVHLAAVGPMMIRAAVAHADGVVGHPFTTPAYIDQTLWPRVEEALASSGRERSDVEVSTGVIVEVDDDRDAARRRARRQVAFYGSTPNYREVFAANGEPELADACRAHLREHGLDRLHDAVPDAALDRYAVAGTAAEVREGLQRWEGLVHHLIVTPPSNGRSRREVAAATSRAADAMAGI